MTSSNRLLEFYGEIASYLTEHIGAEDFFCCVYGSFPALRQTSRSDIDLFVAVPSFNEALLNEIVSFIKTLHTREGLAQDDEVPFENKLLVSYDDVAAAVALEPFLVGTELQVQPVKKSKSFLSSTHIRWRLLFNALTTPHDYIAGDRMRYLVYRMTAEKNLLRLASVLSNPQSGVGVDQLVDALIGDSHGNSGEWFLGYKDYDTIRAYLRFLLLKHHD